MFEVSTFVLEFYSLNDVSEAPIYVLHSSLALRDDIFEKFEKKAFLRLILITIFSFFSQVLVKLII